MSLQSRYATHSDRPVAHRIFTNREGPIALFDVAIARYWERAYPTEDIRVALEDLLGDHDGILGAIADNARDWLDLAQELPAGLGLGLKALNLARRWFKERGAKQACDALLGLEQLDSVQLLDRLPFFLGLDLQAQRQAGSKQTPNPVPILFIDTYEAL